MSSGNTTMIHEGRRRFPWRAVIAAAVACAIIPLSRDAFARARVSVLCYHAFRDAPLKRDPYGFTLDELASHIADLKKRGIRFVSARDVLAGRVDGSNNVLVTVDDGHRSVHEAYRRVFRPNGIRPLLAIYPNVIGKKDYALTWEQLSELAAAGCDVAAHGYYHLKINRKLHEESPRGFRKEIVGSRERLEEKLGRRISIFVYPFGVRSDVTVRAVKEAGYRCAFTIDRGAVAAPVAPGDVAFELPRYMVTRSNWDYCYGRVMKNSGTVAVAAPAAEIKVARATRRAEPAVALLARASEAPARTPERAVKAGKAVNGGLKQQARPSAAKDAKLSQESRPREVASRRKIEEPSLPPSRDAITMAAPVQRVATSVRRDSLLEEWGGMSAVAAPLYEPDAGEGTAREPGSPEQSLEGAAADISAPAPPDRMKRDYRDIRSRSLRTYRDLIKVVREKIDGIRKAIRNYAVRNW